MEEVIEQELLVAQLSPLSNQIATWVNFFSTWSDVPDDGLSCHIFSHRPTRNDRESWMSFEAFSTLPVLQTHVRPFQFSCVPYSPLIERFAGLTDGQNYSIRSQSAS